MSELRQRPAATVEQFEEGAEKDDLQIIQDLLRKVIFKKWRNKHFRRRAGWYIGSVVCLSLYLFYLLIGYLRCEGAALSPAYLGPDPHALDPVYFMDSSKRNRDFSEGSRAKEVFIKKHRLDKIKSDTLPLNRKLVDYRPGVCKAKSYKQTSLKISLVLVLNTAPPSVVLRTIYSAISRTRAHNLAEIIICTQKGAVDVSEQVDIYEYISAHGLSGKVKILTSPLKRTLSAARNHAARAARGHILVFVPEATEMLPGWSDPLLEAYSDNPSLLAGLSMDEVNGETFAQVEHVPWHLISLPRWDFTTAVPIEIPEHEQARRRLIRFPDASPIRTPVLQFPVWAAGREQFLLLAGLDEGMRGSSADVPGALLELSIRWWSCHGEVVYLPCSKAAPVSLLPEAHPAPEGDLQERVYNSKRTAERWAQFYMGEYLTAVPRARNIQVSPSEELSKVISTQSCNSMSWYITNIARDWVFGDRLFKKGSIRSAEADACVDNMGHDGRFSSGRPMFYSCHGGHTQQFQWRTQSNQIRTETGKCLLSDHQWHDVLTLDYCTEGQEWRWEGTAGNKGYLIYKDLCLEYRPSNNLLFYVECKQTPEQQFTFEPFFKN